MSSTPKVHHPSDKVIVLVDGLISDATVSSTSSTRMTTRAKIENNNFISSTGITNDAFEGEDNDDNHDSRSRSSSTEEASKEEREKDPSAEALK